MPATDLRKAFTTDQPSDSAVDHNNDHDDKKQQRRHKRKSKRKHLEKVTAPPPLRPRSRPSSQQSGIRSEGASSGMGVTELGEGLDAIKLNKKQDTQLVTSDIKEDQHDTFSHATETKQVTTGVEETPAIDDKIAVPEDNNINSHSSDNDKDTEATAE